MSIRGVAKRRLWMDVCMDGWMYGGGRLNEQVVNYELLPDVYIYDRFPLSRLERIRAGGAEAAVIEPETSSKLFEFF